MYLASDRNDAVQHAAKAMLGVPKLRLSAVRYMSWANKKKVIYDFGANNGDDIPYYLKKSDLVVAVEANPLLVKEIKLRFADEIANGQLVIEACILSDGEENSGETFYIHKTNHVISQFPRPDDSIINEFEEVRLPSENVVKLIMRYGEPYYIKVDLEHFDQKILMALFQNNIRPPYISAESHSIEVFCSLVSLGKYESFNIVDGAAVCNVYKNHRIKTVAGEETYSFPYHSAGPFGEDICGPWMTPNNFFRYLALNSLGWKDIHATTELMADPAAQPKIT